MNATLGAVLDRMQSYMKDMIDFFADFRDRASDDHARLLTYYFARQKKSLIAIRSFISKEDLAKVQSIPLESGSNEFLPERIFDSEVLVSTAKPAEVLETAIEFIDLLDCLYSWLELQFPDAPVKEALHDLRESGEKEIERMKQLKATRFSGTVERR